MNIHLSTASQCTCQCKIWWLRWHWRWNDSGCLQDLDKPGQPLNDVRKAIFSVWSIKYKCLCPFLFDERAHYFCRKFTSDLPLVTFTGRCTHPSAVVRTGCWKSQLHLHRISLSPERHRQTQGDWDWGRKHLVASDCWWKDTKPSSLASGQLTQWSPSSFSLFSSPPPPSPSFSFSPIVMYLVLQTFKNRNICPLVQNFVAIKS